MPLRKADAEWRGGLKDGKGSIKAESGAINGQYSFSTRFENGVGTNPEELIAAAHATCFAMVMANSLNQAGTPPEQLAVTATCSLDRIDGKLTITAMRLDVRGRVPGVDEATFKQVAEEGGHDCPVSRALANNVAITVNATLEG